ncbi:zinc metalloproteinase nas-14-like [Paramacrobiotus metropolitanus]|uniref:zinc metalloproteinase nas-14-like n=1 Tax=Paramacrobiotus metropolitanus TaxID=2943436 RepID=UPI0024456F20|nr:zinc metalloproteinase nas-14-like [Paramacrobiotus metropolitanus]
MHFVLTAVISWMLWIVGTLPSPIDDKHLLRNDIAWEDEDDGTGYDRFVPATGYLSPSGYWPNDGQQIPYELTGFNDEQRTTIEGAVQTLEWRSNGCVTFRKRTATQNEYILIQHHTGLVPICKADIGRITGRPTRVKLHSRCLSPGIIQHEIMHALGFLHEHSRPDRDEHISIIPGNMVSGVHEINYQKLPEMDTFGLPYDVESLMHYGPKSLSKSPDKPAIVSKVIPAPRWMGQQISLTPLDVAKLQAAYNCSRTERAVVPGHLTTPVRQDISGGTTDTSSIKNAESKGVSVNESLADPPFVYPLPNMPDEPFTKEQCQRQYSAHCYNSSWDPSNLLCGSKRYYHIHCYDVVSQAELLNLFRRMSRPPARLAVLSLQDSRHVNDQTLQPIRMQVIKLYLRNCHTTRMTGKVRGMALTNMISFATAFCADGLVIHKLDFSTSLKLREIIFRQCVIQSVEVGSFSDLVDLRVLTPEHLANADEIKKQRCDPRFASYRQWLSRNSYLTKDRGKGSVYKMNPGADRGMWSPQVWKIHLLKPNVICN